MRPMTQIDWDALLGSAIDAMKRAYCPYSGFPVGAAGLAQRRANRERLQR